MAFSMPELKKAASAVSAAFGVSDPDGRRLVGYYSSAGNNAAVAAIMAGNFDGIPAAAAALGVHLNGVNMDGGRGIPAAGDLPGRKKPVKGGKEKSPGKDTAGRGKGKKSQGKRAGDDLKNGSRGKSAAGGIDGRPADDLPETGPETVAGDVLPGGVSSPELPDGFADKIENWLFDFSARYEIELCKASGQQWRSACIYVGRNIQDSGILRDAEREKIHGGKIYKAERVAALVPIWEYLTGLYKHVPLVTDFIAFAGVSLEWFYDSSGRGLTSSRVELTKKVKAIEAAGIAAGLVDGRENPTGKIFYSKARLGWTEAPRVVEVVHTAAAAAGSLPVFSADGGGLIEEKPGNAANLGS